MKTTHNVTLSSTAIARFCLLLHRTVTRYVTFHAACVHSTNRKVVAKEGLTVVAKERGTRA
jgi:hypothetical protein